jgi:mannosyltransferase OCH1-like enzyme
MQIPKIVHQLWRTDDIPRRWHGAVASVKRYHKGWQYRLWTDAAIDAHVRARHPAFYPIFSGMNRPIMRADAFRYVLMHDFGGVYCDLDYEFVRPYPYGDAAVVLSWEYDETYGDDEYQIANYVLASAPGHPLWCDVIGVLQASRPYAATPDEVCIVTGPRLLTRVHAQNAGRYEGVLVTPKPVFSPRRVHGRREQKFYVNSGLTYGFHHGWGSWRDRLTVEHVKRKLARWTRRPQHFDSTALGR